MPVKPNICQKIYINFFSSLIDNNEHRHILSLLPNMSTIIPFIYLFLLSKIIGNNIQTNMSTRIPYERQSPRCEWFWQRIHRLRRRSFSDKNNIFVHYLRNYFHWLYKQILQSHLLGHPVRCKTIILYQGSNIIFTWAIDMSSKLRGFITKLFSAFSQWYSEHFVTLVSCALKIWNAVE